MSILDASPIRITERFKSLTNEYIEWEFVLLTAWKQHSPGQHGLSSTAARMEVLAKDIGVLGYRAIPVDRLGVTVKDKYIALPDGQKQQIPTGELYEAVPFYLVLNTNAGEERWYLFEGDMTKRGVKYEQDFILHWNGRDSSDRYSSIIDLSRVKEEFRREAQDFPP